MDGVHCRVLSQLTHVFIFSGIRSSCETNEPPCALSETGLFVSLTRESVNILTLMQTMFPGLQNDLATVLQMTFPDSGTELFLVPLSWFHFTDVFYGSIKGTHRVNYDQLFQAFLVQILDVGSNQFQITGSLISYK